MTFMPQGIIPAMVTPFDKEGKVSRVKLRELVNFLLKGGVHYRKPG